MDVADGFTRAMNPSLGLFRCCEWREEKNIRGRNVLTSDGARSNVGGERGNCGVGIGFLLDESGALVVRTLVPEGE
jgi:hypothetical protein